MSAPQLCKSGCGGWIYFDKNSVAGHPAVDKWLPLEYNHDRNVRTGLIHNCPKRPRTQTQQQINVDTNSNGVTQSQLPPQKQPTNGSLEWSGLTHDQLVAKILAEEGPKWLRDHEHSRIAEIYNLLLALDNKVEYLTKLYAQTQDRDNFSKDHNLIDNRI